MTPLRVLYVHHVSCLGGAEQSLLDMISSLDRTMVIPGLALPDDGPLAERLFRIGVEIYFVPLVRPERTANPAKLLCYAGAAVNGIREVVKAATTHGAQVIHANSVMSALCAGPAAKITGAASVLHVRDMIKLGPLRPMVFPLFGKIVCISQCVADFYSLKDTHIIPSGVDLRRFVGTEDGLAVRAAAGFTRDCPVIGMAGQLVEWKNHVDFLRAAARIAAANKNARFVLAGCDLYGGDPSYEKSLHAMVEELGLGDRLHFLGWWDNMAQFYGCLDVLIHPALAEPFGRSLIEAMGCGVPVVAYDSCGPSEIVRNGDTGFLVGQGRWEELADRTLDLLCDDTLRSRMGKTAIKAVGTRFSADVTTPRVADLYETELLSRMS